MLDPALLAQSTPVLELDAAETGLALWNTTLTVLFGTLITRLWVRASENERIQKAAAFISPNVTSKVMRIAKQADEVANMLASGEVPSETIKKKSQELSVSALELMQ